MWALTPQPVMVRLHQLRGEAVAVWEGWLTTELAVGQRLILFPPGETGELVHTSPVVRIMRTGSLTFVETRNSTYCIEPTRVTDAPS